MPIAPPEEAGRERSAAFEWAAWQLNRPEQGDGIVQAFRRPRCDETTKTVRLRRLDATATYRITNFDVVGSVTLSGRDLMEKGYTVEIRDKPGAAVLSYKRMNPPAH